MSHTVTITRTTTSSTGTAVLVNTGFLGSTNGLLKLAQLLLGTACVGVVGYYIDRYSYTINPEAHLFFLLVAVACLVGTFCLFLSCVISFATASIISKTIYEVIYHGLAFILYLAASLTLIIKVNEAKNTYKRYSLYEPYLAASVLGAACTGLVGYYISNGYHAYFWAPTLVYLIAAVSCLMGTFCLFLASAFSLSSAAFISKTNFEVIFHTVACAFYLAASIYLIIECHDNSRSSTYEPYLAASIMGFIMAILYGVSTYFAYRTNKTV